MELGPDDLEVRAGTPLHGVNQWPACLPELRDQVMRYYGAMDGLMRRLLTGFALAAGLPRDGFDHWFEKPLTQMRLLHYPAQQVVQDNMIGARAHRDFGFFTILLQDGTGGLEVSNQSGEWVVAPPIEGMFVVNVAEMLKRRDQRAVQLGAAPGDQPLWARALLGAVLRQPELRRGCWRRCRSSSTRQHPAQFRALCGRGGDAQFLPQPVAERRQDRGVGSFFTLSHFPTGIRSHFSGKCSDASMISTRS